MGADGGENIDSKRAGAPPEERDGELPRWVGLWPVAVTLVVSLAMTGVAYRTLKGQAGERDALRFSHEADSIVEQIGERCALHESKLRGAIGLFNASETVTRDEWRAWVESQELATYLPGVQGFGFAEYIEGAGRQALIERVQSEGFPDFSVHPDSEQPVHAVTVFIEPFEGRNLRAFGYDMYSDPVRRAALERSRDLGVMSITGKLTLVQETVDTAQPGFLMYMPTYGPQGTPGTAAERQSRIRGFVFMPFRMVDLMRGIMGVRRLDVAFRVYDGASGEQSALLYASDPEEPQEEGRLRTSRSLKFGGHEWLLDFVAQPSYESSRLYLPATMAGIGGTAISVLLTVMVWFLSTSRARATRAAGKITLEFRAANARLEASLEQLRARNQSVTMLNEAAETMQSCRTEEEVHRALANICSRLMPGCAGAVFGRSAKTETMKAAITWGEGLKSRLSFETDDCWALRKGRPHAPMDGVSLPCPHVHEADATCSICIPMTASQRMFGILHLEQPADPAGHRTAEQLDIQKQLAITVAEQAALGLANIRLREELHDKSIRDPLTGLYNRRHLDEVIAREFERAEAERTPVGVIIADLDHFKKFNDTHGHDAGDYLLREAARTLREGVRAGDCAARFGGEEFMVVLPGASAAESARIAETLRHAVSQIAPHFNGKFLGTVTASLGVAAYPSCGKVPEQVFRSADEALYASKSGGRNRVTIAREAAGAAEAEARKT